MFCKKAQALRNKDFGREGANREKLTVKKLIDNENLFFHRLCPLQTVKNRRKPWKIGTKPWKNRRQKSTIFSPLVFHRLRLLDLGWHPVIHKNVIHTQKQFAAYLLARLQLQLPKVFSREENFASSSVSRGKRITYKYKKA